MTGPVPKFVRRRRVADKLREAADLLVTGGWIQGEPVDDQGRHCAAGALEAVTEEHPSLYWRATRAVCDHLGTRGLFVWNDRLGRTAEEVIAVLRETAAEQDARAAALEQESRPDGELP